MSSVTFSTTVGGDGSTVTDDDDATTGLRNGGWRTRFVPALAQEVAVAANAVASATAALSSKNAAAASATTATTQASTASTSATAAANSATAAANSYDSFDDRYLGVKTSDPSVDNDGNALLVGALYWNSATSVFKVWSGSAWITNLTSNQFAANVATFLQTPSSANLAAALTNETGTAGKVVFDTNPTFPAQINLTANSGYNIYASGTADNYINGKVGIGDLPTTGCSLTIAKTLSSATSYGVLNYAQINTGVTEANLNMTLPYTQASSSITTLRHFYATLASIGAGGSIGTQYGFNAELNLTGATNNYGFYGGINASAGTTRYNLYMAGTADNYLAGSLGIGGFAGADSVLQVNKAVTSGITEYMIRTYTTVPSNITNAHFSFSSTLFTQAATFTLSSYTHYDAAQSTLGAGSAVGNQFGFTAGALKDATNNYGFYGGINYSAGTTRYNLYMGGSADNYLAGNLSVGGINASYKVNVDHSANSNVARFYQSGASLNTDIYIDNVGAASNFLISRRSSGESWFYNSGANPFVFYTNAAERLRIDQSGNVGIGTSSPSASAILDAQSTTKGVRFPNMTTTQKNAVSSPAAGLVVFDTILSKLCVYTGAAWQTITSV